MLQIIDNKSEILKTQHKFIGIFKDYWDKKTKSFVKYRGGRHRTTIQWSSELQLWGVFEKIENRYWNAFGLNEPESEKSYPIAVEINVPFRGINRKANGVFLKSNSGDIFLGHRGKIGNIRGLTKEYFFSNYRGEFIEIEDGDQVNEVALVGDLDASNFVHQIREFVNESNRIKDIIKEGRGVEPPKSKFSPEFKGVRNYTLGKAIKARCNHGLIVGELYKSLKSQGLNISNDRRDLFVLDSSGRITTIFEIKTDLLSTSLYTAIGQLMFYSIDLKKKPKLVVVLPCPSDDLISLLVKMGFECISFTMSGNKVWFENLDDIL